METGAQEIKENLEGIPEVFHSVVQMYGRDLFEVVMAAGMSGEAAQVLAGVLQKQHSTHGLQALRVLIDSFNKLSNAWVRAHGWTPEQLGACESAIKQTFAGELTVVEKPLIVLAH